MKTKVILGHYHLGPLLFCPKNNLSVKINILTSKELFRSRKLEFV